MKKYLFAIILCLVAGVAQAKGVPFAVSSLTAAEATARKDGNKHLLIFFTSET